VTSSRHVPRELEPIAARGWPAARSGRLGGWLLFASDGHSGRINACWPIGEPGLPLDEAVAWAEAWYVRRGLPTLFKIVEAACDPAELPQFLTARGYRPHTETLLMTGGVNGVESGVVSVSDRLEAQFADVFAATGAGQGDSAERLAALARMPTPRGFARLDIDGATAAIGACAVDGEWAGVFAMRTDPRRRRSGLARGVLGGLLAFAQRSGARHAYLQVEATNIAALALYRQAGFEEAYRYRYWSRSRGAPHTVSAG